MLFPKYCVSCKKLGAYICANCFAHLSFDTHSRCLVCDKHSLDGRTHPPCRGKHHIDGSFSSIRYSHIAKKLMYVFKYEPYISHLHEVLGELLYEGLIQKEVFHTVLTKNSVLLPIPLSSQKERRRGYNQAELLARSLSLRFSLPVVSWLKRTKNTRSQTELNRQERSQNVVGVFGLRSNVQFDQHTTVFLIDDVLTTGATLSEAAAVLKKSGIKEVWGITLAQD